MLADSHIGTCTRRNIRTCTPPSHLCTHTFTYSHIYSTSPSLHLHLQTCAYVLSRDAFGTFARVFRQAIGALIHSHIRSCTPPSHRCTQTFTHSHTYSTKPSMHLYIYTLKCALIHEAVCICARVLGLAFYLIFKML